MSNVIEVTIMESKPTSVIVLQARTPDEYDCLADADAIFYHLRDVLPATTMLTLAHAFEQYAIQERRGLW